MSKELNPAVVELSARLVKGITIAKDHTVSVNDDLYTSTLPEGLTKAIVEQVSDHNAVFIAASGDAFGKLATQAMVKDKSLAELTVVIPTVRKDHVDQTFTRTVVSTNAFAKTEAEKQVTKHGVLSTSYSIRAGKNKGDLQAVRAQLSEAAGKLFAK